MSEQTYEGTLQTVSQVTPTTLSIQCSTSPEISYQAGQHVMLSFPNSPALSKEKSPEWPIAIASGPSDSNLEFCIRRVEGSAIAEHLAHLQPGQTISMRGPMGDFLYHNPEQKPVVFVATGTGIAPLRSMMRSREFQANRPDTTLLLGAQTEAEIPYHSEWLESRLRFIPVLSQAPEAWPGERGWVTDYMQKTPQVWADPNALYYLCGQWEMLKLSKEILETCGVPAASIRTPY